MNMKEDKYKNVLVALLPDGNNDKKRVLLR